MSGDDRNERQFKYRLWRVNLNGQTVEGRWRNAFGAITGAASKLFGGGPLASEHDFEDLAIHVECIGQPETRPEAEEIRCAHCDGGMPSVWDSELEWFAHTMGEKLATCAHPWRQREVR